MSEDPQALGLRLKAERERRGMSTQKIAKGMHVDDWVIDALETGDYQRIGPAVYAKGHLKKYASLLGVSTAPPAPEPAAAATAVGNQPVPIVRLDPPKDAPAAWPRLGTVAAVAILAGGVFWWRETHRGTPVSAPTAEPASPAMTSATSSPTDQAAALAQSEETTDAQGSLAAADTAPADAPANAVATSVVSRPPAAAMTANTASPASPIAAAATAPAGADLTPGVGKARLRLSFSADSWVDIRDYSGKRVFTGNGRANSVKTIAGMAPFRVYLRSAGGVQLQLNDRAVAIGRQFISGDEAHFEAGADGVLRRDAPGAAGSGPETAAVSPHG